MLNQRPKEKHIVLNSTQLSGFGKYMTLFLKFF